jgi:hypothetical protein
MTTHTCCVITVGLFNNKKDLLLLLLITGIACTHDQHALQHDHAVVEHNNVISHVVTHSSSPVGQEKILVFFLNV